MILFLQNSIFNTVVKYVLVWTFDVNFFLKILEDLSPFCGTTDTPVFGFWWHLNRVSNPGWIPCLHDSGPTSNRFLRFTSGVTPAGLLATRMAFWLTYLQIPLAWVGINPWPGVLQQNILNKFHIKLKLDFHVVTVSALYWNPYIEPNFAWSYPWYTG